MRLGGDLDQRRADPEPCTGRQVRPAEVEIHVELVACEGPALAHAGEQRDHASVHQRQLNVRIGAPCSPPVADEPFGLVELALVENLTLVDGRTSHEQLEPTIGRR